MSQINVGRYGAIELKTICQRNMVLAASLVVFMIATWKCIFKPDIRSEMPVFVFALND